VHALTSVVNNKQIADKFDFDAFSQMHEIEIMLQPL
jgi:hypothetical protein